MNLKSRINQLERVDRGRPTDTRPLSERIHSLLTAAEAGDVTVELAARAARIREILDRAEKRE